MQFHTTLYRIVPSTGKTKELSANNYKEIKEALSTDCTLSPQSGIYWVQNHQVLIYVYLVPCKNASMQTL